MSDVDAQSWALRGAGSASAAEWFSQRFARARALLPAANFDTVIPVEFAETITTELVDVVGVASADPATATTGGAVQLEVGDLVTTPSQARLQLVGSGSHVAGLNTESWYMAGLCKFSDPDAAEIGDTSADMIGLWVDDNNRVMLGVRGNASGGSTSEWVGSARLAASESNTLGPTLDPDEAPLWHLFEMWFNVVTGNLTFAVDGSLFTGIQAADMPAVAAKISMIINRSAVGDPAVVIYEKVALVVKSPTPGSP